MNPLLLKAAPYVAIAALLAFGKCTYDGRRRAEGRAEAAEAQRTNAIAAAAKREDSLRARQAAEVATLNTELARWQQIKQRVRVVAKWDTPPPDTVPGPERVVERIVTRPPTIDEIIEQANRTINACQLALGTCDQRIRNLLLANDSLAASIRFWRGEARPSLWKQFQQLPGRAVVPATVGAAVWAACKL